MEQYQLHRDEMLPNKWRLVDTVNRFEIRFDAGKFNETQQLHEYADCILSRPNQSPDIMAMTWAKALREAADWLAANYAKIACEPPKFTYQLDGDTITIKREKNLPNITITVVGLRNKTPKGVAAELLKIEKWLNKRI